MKHGPGKLETFGNKVGYEIRRQGTMENDGIAFPSREKEVPGHLMDKGGIGGFQEAGLTP